MSATAGSCRNQIEQGLAGLTVRLSAEIGVFSPPIDSPLLPEIDVAGDIPSIIDECRAVFRYTIQTTAVSASSNRVHFAVIPSAGSGPDLDNRGTTVPGVLYQKQTSVPSRLAESGSR